MDELRLLKIKERLRDPTVTVGEIRVLIDKAVAYSPDPIVTQFLDPKGNVVSDDLTIVAYKALYEPDSKVIQLFNRLERP